MDAAADLASLRHVARAAGFSWTDAELAEIRPMVEAVLRALASLDAIDVGPAEPTTHYRIL